MFRPSLRSIFLLSILLLAIPRSAHAVDVTEVSLTVTLAHSSVSSDTFEVAVRVTGIGSLNNGSITPPVTAVPAIPISFQQDGQDLVVTKTYNSETALNAAWPNGNYGLSINNGTVQATLAYTRRLVPDPAISKPNAGGTVAPGPVELLFTNCATCNLGLDSVEAVLEDNANVVLAQETLTSTSDSWIPQGVGGDLQLPEQSSFVASITFETEDDTNVIATGDDTPPLKFSNHLVRSDEIDFDTGFDTPAGSLCLAASYDTTPPPAGCTILSDPLLQVLDASGAYVTQVDGHDVQYTISVADKGTITGSATADLDGNASQETGPAPIKGKFSGKSGESKSKLSFALENTAPEAKVKVKISDEYSIPGNTFEGTQKASGSINGAKLKEEVLSSGPLPLPPLGWLLQLDIDSSGAVQNALLTLESGRTFPLSGTNKFKFASGESSLKLQSGDKGIRMDLKKIHLDDATNPMAISGGDVSPRILGQKAKSTIP